MKLKLQLTAALRNRLALAGLLITFVVLLAITLGAALMPYSAEEMDFVNILVPPSLAHPFGTDAFGRDVLTRVLMGGRMSLAISLSAIVLASLVGTLMGSLSAYHGGWTDAVLMRFSDLLFAFPSFVLALFLMVVLGFGTTNVILAIALIYLPIFARIARNMTLLIKEEPYVQAARLMGRSPMAIILGEIVPNFSAPLLVQASIGVAFGIIVEAGLSFIGLGVQPPDVDWGVLVAEGARYITSAPNLAFVPSIVIALVSTAFVVLADNERRILGSRQ